MEMLLLCGLGWVGMRCAGFHARSGGSLARRIEAGGGKLFVIVYRSGLTKGTGVLSGARRIDVTMSITRIPL